jgi:hypothetical protein
MLHVKLFQRFRYNLYGTYLQFIYHEKFDMLRNFDGKNKKFTT